MLKSLEKKTAVCIFVFIAIMLLATTLYAQDSNNNFKIEQQTATNIKISFNLGDWSVDNKIIDGVAYKTIRSDAKHNLLIDETETLPLYSTLIAIPEGMDVQLSTDKIDSDQIRSVKLIYSDIIKREIGKGDTYPSEQIRISEPGQFRDFRVVSINVYPFQLNTKTNSLNVTKSVTLNLNFVPSREIVTNRFNGYYSPGFDNLYRSLILNYNNQRDELTPTKQPVLLIIYPVAGDATFLTSLNELVNWKRQKGYIVNAVSTVALGSGGAGSTTTDIKSYIQTQYDNLVTRPDAVLMIGDPVTGLIVPSYSSEYGDFPYTQLAGGDEYGDVQFGRISVTANDQFATYVAKVMA